MQHLKYVIITQEGICFSKVTFFGYYSDGAKHAQTAA